MIGFLLPFAILSFVVGFGWCPLTMTIVALKSMFVPKKRESGLKEMSFLADWALMQIFLGLVTMIAFPLSFLFLESSIVIHSAFLYFLVSCISAIVVCSMFFKDK